MPVWVAGLHVQSVARGLLLVLRWPRGQLGVLCPSVEVAVVRLRGFFPARVFGLSLGLFGHACVRHVLAPACVFLVRAVLGRGFLHDSPSVRL